MNGHGGAPLLVSVVGPLFTALNKSFSVAAQAIDLVEAVCEDLFDPQHLQQGFTKGTVMSVDIGGRLRFIRARHKLSQRELAKRSGVTVRTLHHYDNLDLLKPSARSDAGYRLYDRKDVERLHHIQALRGLGLSLTDIGALLNQRAVSLPGLIDQQLLQLDRQLQSLQRLRSRLHRLRERYVLGEEPALTDLLDTLGSMIMYEKHFSADELARLAFTERLDQGTSAWPALAEQAKALMEAGVPPQAEQAQRLARDWMIQLERDTAQDPALLTRLDTMHAAEPGLQQRTGVSQAMRDYVLAAFAEYRLAIYRRHLTDDEFARMRTHYAASLRQWPELLAQLQRCRSERLPPEHERVIALARRWGELFSAYAGPNADTQRRIQQAEQQEPELQAGTWVAPELIDYLRQAMTTLMQHARN